KQIDMKYIIILIAIVLISAAEFPYEYLKESSEGTMITMSEEPTINETYPIKVLADSIYLRENEYKRDGRTIKVSDYIYRGNKIKVQSVQVWYWHKKQ